MLYAYTVASDGFDNIRPPTVITRSSNVQYICFTNVPNLPNVHPWQYRPLIDLGNPSRTNRLPKILPHLMLPTDAEESVYFDGNFQLTQFPEELVGNLLANHDWAAHKHPVRDCVYKEADVILNHESMAGWRAQKPESERVQPIEREIERYRAEGYPEHNGLWANGLLIRRHTPAVKALCIDWWKVFSAGGERDQLSFPVVRQKSGLEVHTLGGHISESPFVNFWFHAAWAKNSHNHPFVPERKRVAENLEMISKLTGVPNRFQVHEWDGVE